MLFFKLILLVTAISFISYFMTTMIVDVALLGRLDFYFSAKARAKDFLVTKANRIDFQDGFKCSGFSSAFVMRHWNISTDGNSAYEKMPNKMRGGYVYPKGIFNFLSKNGFKVKYCRGNLNSLKNEVATGNPVIAMIKIRPDKNWLHYVPVVGTTGRISLPQNRSPSFQTATNLITIEESRQKNSRSSGTPQCQKCRCMLTRFLRWKDKESVFLSCVHLAFHRINLSGLAPFARENFF